MTEPELVTVHLNQRDDKGKEYWTTMQLALTDELVNALKNKIQPEPIVVDKTVEINYDAKRLELYRRFIRTRCTFTSSLHNLRFENRTKDKAIPLSKTSVFHPEDYTALVNGLAMLDELEKESKKDK